MTGEDQQMNAATDIGLETFFAQVVEDDHVTPYVEAAKMARSNALERLRMAKEWPAYAEHDLAVARECWARCRHLMATARRLRDTY